ncbi:MAG TPA: SCO family protein [Verrucomicrobiae bacterium]|jgi:protein SCO1/2
MEWIVWGGLLVAILALLALFVILPVRRQALPMLGSLPDFVLTDQNRQNVTLDSLRGQVWIADAIFTRCAGQCPIMSSHMQALQDKMPAGLPVKLVSFTTDPDFDTPGVLKKYAVRYQARDGQWMFLTGSKADLRHAMVDGLKLGVMDKPPGERENAVDLFIHSEKFVLIDQQGQIRGYYDGENAEGVAETLAAAKTLARP